MLAVIFASYLLQFGIAKLFGRRKEWVIARARKVHRRNSRRMLRGILKLRGVYIKLGQVLSIMGTFLPRAFTEELEQLQDAVPPHPYHEIEKSFLDSLGSTPKELYAEFDEVPLAAASLGQVHRAKSKDGVALAVKVLYPRVDAIIAVDLRVLRMMMKVYCIFIPIAALERIVDQLEDLLRRETSYKHEAECIEKMAANFTGEPDILFPKVVWDCTSDRVLTMTFMEGMKIGNVKGLTEAKLDPEAVARRLVQVFYKQLFFDKFFHADPHPGNFLVQGRDGVFKLVVLDFGAASTVSDTLLDGMLEALSGLVSRDDVALIGGIDKMGFISKNGNRELLERTVKTYFQKLLRLNLTDFGKIKGEAARELADPGVEPRELRELMKAVEYPDGWFFVERSAILMFGLCARLAPKLNTVMVGFPYVMQLLAAKRAASGTGKPSPGGPRAVA